MAEKKKINASLIVATYNWPEALTLVLESAARQTLLPMEVVVADDGSDERTKAVIDAFRERAPFPVRHVWHPDEGFRLAEIRNKAMMAAAGEYLIQIDGDIVMHPDFVADHVGAAEPGYFIAGGRISLSPEQSQQLLEGTEITLLKGFSWGRKMKMKHIPLLAHMLHGYKSGDFLRAFGANLSFWAEDVRAVNGYDEEFKGWGFEDSDFIFRIMSLGRKKRYLRYAAICYHLWHAERKSTESWERNKVILERNRNGKRIVCENGMVNKKHR